MKRQLLWRNLIITSIVLVLVITLIIVLMLVKSETFSGPITCSNDEQCGGNIMASTFCRDSDLWGEGQSNKCINPGTTESRCETSYDQFLVETCEQGCNRNGCA